MGRLPKITMAAAMVAALLASPACCEGPKEPCYPWVKIGESYKIELMDHYPTGSNPKRIAPYMEYHYSEISCGNLDIQRGRQIEATAIEGAENQMSMDIACASCQYVMADFNVQGVERITDGKLVGLNAEGTLEFARRQRVTLGNGCYGGYEIAVVQVDKYFLEESGVYVPTDYMLIRQFRGDDGTTCAELYPQTRKGCRDIWSVRIWDESGKMITREFPAPTDAGTTPAGAGAGMRDASVVDEDASAGGP